MKAFEFVFVLIMILALISGTVALAQEIDPPERSEPPAGEVVQPASEFGPHARVDTSPTIEGDIAQLEAEKQQAMRDLGMINELPFMETFDPPFLPQEDFIGFSDELILDDDLQTPIWPTMPYEKEGEQDALEDNAARTVHPVSGTIYIANSIDEDWWPAVAHGGGHYMVVYTHNFDIVARVYSDTGGYQSTHTVADFPNNCENPSVAYEASSGLFLVTFEYYWSETDHDIYVQAVSPTTGNRGGVSTAGTTVYNESYPDVDCKHTNGTCLVAYQHNHEYRIKGRFFTLTNMGISAMSAIYDLTDAKQSSGPALAWGKGTGYYLVTYKWSFTGKNQAMYSKVYDSPVSSGDQYVHGNAVVDNPSVGLNNKFSTDVAFDPCTQTFVVSFHYDYAGDASDIDIYAVAKNAGSSAFGYIPFSVANSIQNESQGVISFVTDNHLAPKCGAMDKLVVAYNNFQVGIKAADLRGNSNTADPLYARDEYFNHLVVASNSGSWIKIHPAISSGSAQAEMFIAYNPLYQYSPWDNDVWGRIVDVRLRTYLPLITR
jgi:hypothetical protein